jgi:hypothetical protein
MIVEARHGSSYNLSGMTATADTVTPSGEVGARMKLPISAFRSVLTIV